MKLVLFAAGAAVVAGKCANDCSSHGECNAKNQCECHRNFFGPDCSQRLCPAGRAFIDSAVGDVNGDNSVGVDLVAAQGRASTPISEFFSYQYGAGRDSHDVTASWNEAHFYQECSNKGVCDTSTGQCACFPGYEGSGCARKSCENDCSGHGACKNYEGTSYNMWDADATLYCHCDSGYTGPGCEKRVCPSGVDPVEGSNVDASRMYRIAFRTLSAADGDFDESTFYQVPFGPVTWTVRLTDEFGDEWTTSTLTTNYDVIVGDTGAPEFSFPIITGATSDTAGSAEYLDASSEYAIAEGVVTASAWNAFGDGNYHVAAQLEDALEALPDGASGSVRVHEVYTSPSTVGLDAGLLSMTYPAPFTGMDNEDYHLEWPVICGAKDIYISGEEANSQGAVVSASQSNIAGCGVAILDYQLGTGACVERQGNNDINDAIEGTGAYEGVTIVNQLSDSDLLIVTQTNDVDQSSDHLNVLVTDEDVSSSLAGFPLFDETTIYYQWPHFSNADSASERFPLFTDLEADCENVDGFYAVSSSYYTDVLSFSAEAPAFAGLSLFLYFSESTIETAPNVDYSFNNYAADHYAGDLFADQGAVGETIEGISNGMGAYTSHSLVHVSDVTGDRSWDISYHGRRAYFLDDASDTSTGVDTHTCAKRGICDYTTGLCDCFSGFTGDNCAIQNALAF